MIEKKKLIIPNKKIDYLKDFIKKRKQSELNSDNENSIRKEKEKWDKIIKDNKNSFKQNIQAIKIKAGYLEQLANEKQKILKRLEIKINNLKKNLIIFN